MLFTNQSARKLLKITSPRAPNDLICGKNKIQRKISCNESLEIHRRYDDYKSL